MRVVASALLAVLAAGPNLSGPDGLAVSIVARPVAGSCAVAGTGTITAYDATSPREIAYRFVRSDGSVSPTRYVTFTGDGVVAQSVADAWTPNGASPWVALEIVSPRHLRSRRAPVSARCPRRVAATVR